MNKTVLLVIDIQDATTLLLIGKGKLLNNINILIDYFKANNLPIIYVKQAGAGNLKKQLHIEKSDYIVTKNKPSSFTSEEFCKVVEDLKTKEFVVTGLMSNACIQATCKSALEKDFKVTLVEDGHDSIIKPFRAVFNRYLKNKGAILVKSSDFLIKKWRMEIDNSLKEK